MRKDVSLIGYKGKPKAGYSILGLKKAIEEFLGINYENTAILIGAGRLGSALSQYPGLAQYGLRLVAIFDSDPARTGSVLGAFTILPMESLQRVVRSFDVGIAIICVPKDAAQRVAGRIVSLGIKAIWNFSPTQLTLPSDVIVRNENIALGLAILSHYLKRRKKEDTPARGGGDTGESAAEADRHLRPLPAQAGVPRADPRGHAEGIRVSFPRVNRPHRRLPECHPGEGGGGRGILPGLPDGAPGAVPHFHLHAGRPAPGRAPHELLEVIARELRISDGETTADGSFCLETVPCRGMCAEAPIVSINDAVVHPRERPEDLASAPARARIPDIAGS